MNTESAYYANGGAYGISEAGVTPTATGNLSDALPAQMPNVTVDTGTFNFNPGVDSSPDYNGSNRANDGGVDPGSQAPADGMNFSVFKLEQVFDVFYNKVAAMCTELTSVKDKASTASRIVASEDSGLGEAWNNVGAAMNKFEQKLVDLTTEINVNIKNYVEETVKNEVAAAANTEAIAKDISRITSDLDAIFQ